MWTEPVRDRVFHSKQVVDLEGRENQLNIQVITFWTYEIPTSYLKFEIQKLWKATLGFGIHFDEHHVQK